VRSSRPIGSRSKSLGGASFSFHFLVLTWSLSRLTLDDVGTSRASEHLAGTTPVDIREDKKYIRSRPHIVVVNSLAAVQCINHTHTTNNLIDTLSLSFPRRKPVLCCVLVFLRLVTFIHTLRPIPYPCRAPAWLRYLSAYTPNPNLTHKPTCGYILRLFSWRVSPDIEVAYLSHPVGLSSAVFLNTYITRTMLSQKVCENVCEKVRFRYLSRRVCQ
jgi:hypothetical protein